MLNKSEQEIFAEICESKNLEQVKETILKLTRDPVLHSDLWHFLANGLVETRGVMNYLAKHLKPKNYLEIGVRRGWSMAMVVSNSPDCDVYAFDEWQGHYSGSPNPGPEFVQAEMEKVDYKKQINFYNGNSHQTLPYFFGEYKNIEFDLILVDGDHTIEGGWQDLVDTFPHVKIGGVLVFDDIEANFMYSVWERAIKEYGDKFKFYTFAEYRPGVGFAVRIK